MRQQLLEDMLSFLHHPEQELRKDQDLNLPGTLCTSLCLVMEKTTLWFQLL